MYAAERQQEVLAQARLDGSVEVKSLADALNVTPETVRRDLTSLERRGLVRRVHGGAIPVERLDIEPDVADREGHMVAEKERIAAVALEKVPDGGAIIIDAGTTTSRLAKMLPTDRDLTVVTHGLPIAMLLASRANITLHLLGGTVRHRTLAAVGPWAERSIADVHTEVVFLGANGISPEHGLTTPDLGEAMVKQALVAGARRKIALLDHTKFGRADFAQFAALSAIDMVITDAGVDAELAAEIEAAGPQLVRA